MSSKPLVSVIVTTYNLEKYIAECLDSILNQKIKFTYEVLVGDDNSTDNTTAILKYYEDIHPEIFKVTYRSRNVRMNLNMIDLIQKAKGKYIAIMDGDDIWTDQNKLQTQIDFLEANPTYSLCFHDAEICNSNLEFISLYSKRHPSIKGRFDFDYIVYLNGYLGPTSSIVFKNFKNLFPLWAKKTIDGLETLLFILLRQYGNYHFLPEVMSIYRKHALSNSADGNYSKLAAIKTSIHNNKLFYKEMLFPNYPVFYIKKILYKQFTLLGYSLRSKKRKENLYELFEVFKMLFYFFYVIITKTKYLFFYKKAGSIYYQ